MCHIKEGPLKKTRYSIELENILENILFQFNLPSSCVEAVAFVAEISTKY